jgi:2-haloacid dehalogenase
VPIRAFLCDTYGTVCDFFRPLRRTFEELGRERGVSFDAAALAIGWRNAYARSTLRHAFAGAPFRPLKELHQENLARLLAPHLPAPLAQEELARIATVWNRLEPWPDAVPGLTALKQLAVIAPLSNGNFDDMVALARHAGLPWDIILGSSIARAYKPRPEIYLESVAALALAPEQVCMVAAHQVDLRYAAGHGMQTAFIARPDEFGGAVKPEHPEPGVDYSAHAEIHAEDAWTFVASDLVDLARQCRA